MVTVTATRMAKIPLDRVFAVLFDMDGVVTDTASVHAAAWKRAFDELLISRSRTGRGRFQPFDLREDYRRFVDGQPRADGVRMFLASRGVTLPEEEPSGRPEAVTVPSLGDRKDRYFLDYIHRYGAAAFPASVALVRALRRRGVAVAAVSANRNCAAVLKAAGIADLFDARVDGIEASRLRLPGKPDSALFLEAARRVAVPPVAAAVVEDSPAGVEAARTGGFGFVVGVDRMGRRAELRDRGADVVVADLSELSFGGEGEAATP